MCGRFTLTTKLDNLQARFGIDTEDLEVMPKPESTEGGRLVSILKWPEGAPLNLG